VALRSRLSPGVPLSRCGATVCTGTGIVKQSPEFVARSRTVGPSQFIGLGDPPSACSSIPRYLVSRIAAITGRSGRT
jgi:hypothetical protein